MGQVFTADALFEGDELLTTDENATDVGSLSWVATDKRVEVYKLEGYAVQQNASNPLRFYIKRTFVVRFSGGVPTVDSPTAEVKVGDTNQNVTMATASGNIVKIQATGLIATNFWWKIRATRSAWSST